MEAATDAIAVSFTFNESEAERITNDRQVRTEKQGQDVNKQRYTYSTPPPPTILSTSQFSETHVSQQTTFQPHNAIFFGGAEKKIIPHNIPLIILCPFSLSQITFLSLSFLLFVCLDVSLGFPLISRCLFLSEPICCCNLQRL